MAACRVLHQHPQGELKARKLTQLWENWVDFQCCKVNMVNGYILRFHVQISMYLMTLIESVESHAVIVWIV